MLKPININTGLDNSQLKDKYYGLAMDSQDYFDNNDITIDIDDCVKLTDRYHNKIMLDYGTYRAGLIDCHNILVELVNNNIDNLASYPRYNELKIS